MGVYFEAMWLTKYMQKLFGNKSFMENCTERKKLISLFYVNYRFYILQKNLTLDDIAQYNA
jgi:hypothetical protein